MLLSKSNYIIILDIKKNNIKIIDYYYCYAKIIKLGKKETRFLMLLSDNELKTTEEILNFMNYSQANIAIMIKRIFNKTGIIIHNRKKYGYTLEQEILINY